MVNFLHPRKNIILGLVLVKSAINFTKFVIENSIHIYEKSNNIYLYNKYILI
jgi:hypothetical protein